MTADALLVNSLTPMLALLSPQREVTTVSILIVLAAAAAMMWMATRTERAREEALQSLHQSERRLYQQIEHMPIACIVRDAGLRIESWNPAAESIFGWSEQEMAGQTTDCLVPHEAREHVDTMRRRILRGESTSNSVHENVTKDGRRVVCRWSNTPLVGADGKIFSVLSMVEDVTAREQARRELRQSEERYRMLVEHAPDAIIVHTGGVIRFANRATAELVGAAAPVNIIGRRVLDFISPDGQRAMIDAIRRMETTRQPAMHRDIQLRRIDGGIVEAELTAIPIEFDRDRAALILARDVTERKRAERAHQESEERYRALFEHAPDGILVRIGETIVFANPTAERLLSCPAGGLVGRSIWALVHPDDSALISERMHVVDVDRRTVEIAEYRWCGCTGEMIEVEAVGSPMTWEGQPAAQIIFRDVTERNASRRALESTQERYRRVVENAPEPIVVHREGRVLYANNAAAALCGVEEASSLEGRSILEFVHPDSRVEVARRLRQRGETPLEVLHWDVDARRADGVAISVSVTAVPIDYDGAEAILLHMRDVTEAKSAETELRASEERYRRVVESMNEGLAVLDDQQRTVYANEQFCKIVDLRPEEFVGQHASAHWAHVSSGTLEQRLDRRRRGIADRYEETYTRCSGGDVTVSVSASPIMDGSRFLGSVVLLSDITDRKRTENALRQSEARYRMLVEHSPDAIVVHSGGRLVFANPAAAALIGASDPSEFIGRSVVDFVHPSSRAEIVDRLLHRDEFLEVVEYEARLYALDGSTIEVGVTAIPIEYVGDDRAVLVILRDITERKRTEEKLRESEERYRELFDSSPNFIFSVDRANRYLTVNRAVCEAFGRPAADIVGHSPAELGLKAGPAAEWAAAHEVVRRTGAAYEHDTRIVLPDGQTILTRSLLSPLRDRSGAIVGVSGMAIDVTAQTVAQAAVQQLLSAVEQIDEVMFTTDFEGKITYANPAFQRVYGWSREEVIGQTPRILKSGHMPAEHYEEFWRSIRAGSVVRAEYVNRAKDGSLVRVMGSAAPVFGKDGEIAGFIAVQQDITQQRAIEDEKRRLDDRLGHLAKMEALGTLAGGVAHDFNNILSIILSHATVIDRRAADAERVKTAVTTIRQAVHRGAALSKQILTFARRGEFNPEAVDITKLVAELGSMVGETFPRMIQLSFATAADLPRVQGDAGQIHQALLNLCVNARDAMPSGGTITLDARVVRSDRMRSDFADASGNDFVLISLSDTGSGIDEETKQRIFEPFFTTKEKGKGTGLGLALVYGVVKSHNGYIELDSTPGRGTEFRLYFPAVRRPSIATAENDAQQTGRGCETVLVIDDEEALLTMTAACLRDHGYDVVEATSGNAAVERARQLARPLDAVVMDLGMPGMSPVETIAALREVAPDAPFIAMTGYVDPEMHALVRAAGVKQILQKPLEPDDLLAHLRSAVDPQTGR